jgi:acetyl esterase
MPKIISTSRREFQNHTTHFMTYRRLTVLAGIFSAAGIYFNACQLIAQTQDAVKTFTVTVDKPENGSLSIEPPVPEDGKVPEGTVLALKASPASGFALDSHYYRFGRTYFESMAPVFKVTVSRNLGVGASFIEAKALEGFTVTHDIVYAQPGVKKLKYDVFTPKGATNLPCIVIIHGGGWSVNSEDVMRGLARELVRGGRYVVASIDYRWIGTHDGDAKPNTMADIMGDVFGALAHIQERARSYGADPARIAVTGDSAGGHMSAAAIDMVDHIGDEGFGVKPGVYQFKPTYLPPGKSAAQVREELTHAIKAAAPSYGVFNAGSMRQFTPGESDAGRKALAPLDNVPNISQRAVPQYLLRGTVDPLIKDADVQAYADALKSAGQRAEYVQVEGAAHAFLDWKPDSQTKQTFIKYGIPYSAKMREFFDSIFYP